MEVRDVVGYPVGWKQADEKLKLKNFKKSKHCYIMAQSGSCRYSVTEVLDSKNLQF